MLHSYSDSDCRNLGPFVLPDAVTNGPRSRDFGVLGSATEALLAGFVWLY